MTECTNCHKYIQVREIRRCKECGRPFCNRCLHFGLCHDCELGTKDETYDDEDTEPKDLNCCV